MRTIIGLLLIVAFMALAEGLARAQQPKKIPQVGWIALFGPDNPNSRPPGLLTMAFMAALLERGYIEGQNIIIHYRSADYQSTEGREDRLSKIAAELVRLNVDVIVADTNAATAAAAKATTTIPIVFLHGDPVRGGVVPSLANPGRNLTGLSSLSSQLAGKRLELFKDAVSNITRVAILLNPDASIHTGQFADMQVVARALGLQLQAMELRDSNLDCDSVFQQTVKHHTNALLILPNPIVNFHRRRILELAAKSRLPAMYPFTGFTEAGGLMSYGPNSADQYRRAAYFVDRILKGAKPSDLPVEQPTKFELVINLKTAKTLGLTISPKVLMWADRVISDGGQMREKTVATTYSREGQRSKKIFRIGVLSPGKGGGPDIEAFKQKLHALGYIEGENVAFEYRSAGGNEDRLPGLAAELLSKNVDMIVATSVRGARAAQQLTRTIPIVATAIPGPGGSGLVDSLQRPGGNVTGLSFMRPELGGKRLELLKEAIPGLSRVAVLLNEANIEERAIEEIESAARSFGLELQILNVKVSSEFENAFSLMAKGRVGALTVQTQAMLVLNRKRVVELAAKSRLAAIYPRKEFVEAGGLMSYGPDHTDLYRRAAIYVDKILKGAKPSELPVEQPTKFELVINLKAAKQIGLAMPRQVLMWADRVIK